MARTGPKGVFITATDTGVGKTWVTCWLARALSERGLRLGLCKPAASGAELSNGELIWEDPAQLCRSLTPALDDRLVTPHRFIEPLAPNVAARRDPVWANRPLTLEHYQQAIERWTGECEFLLVEGVGGLLCPITDDAMIADLIHWWDRPVLIVARLGLGTINHTLLTLESARARGLRVLGIVLNRSDAGAWTLADETNPAELRRLVDVPVWGPIPFQAQIEPTPEAFREIADEVLSNC